MAAYFLYKLARRDFTLWIAGLEGAMKFIAAVLTHTVVKIIVDFIGSVLFRGPRLMGGMLQLIVTLYSQILPFVALFLYEKASDTSR